MPQNDAPKSSAPEFDPLDHDMSPDIDHDYDPEGDERQHNQMANAIRALAMDAIEKANSGHPGMPMGMADVATVLFRDFMRFDASAPDWPNRDRFVLSAGHGSMLLYSLLYLTGYSQPSLNDIKNFRQLHSPAAGHPEFGDCVGVETTTGPLGQGLATAVGMALAERRAAHEFGDEIYNHYTYVIAGDGCLMEGVSHEAISLAGHFKLSKLIVLFDDNNISIDGATELAVSEDTQARFEAAGWHVQSVDGHDAVSLNAAIAEARLSDQPSLIACRTTIGYGAPKKAGTAGCHGSPLGAEEIAGARAALNWPYAPFEIPVDILENWRAVGRKGHAERFDWESKLAALPKSRSDDLARRLSGALPADFAPALDSYIAGLIAKPVTVATRKASQMVLELINAHIPEMLGGSADLTGSNLTKTSKMTPMSADDFSGNYIHYGVREFGMAAAMNGMSLHGTALPYAGGFLVFSDYARPAIRLAALMHQRVIHVMTHDSIGLGEDGPTHQPIEHLASLRAMPGVKLYRPADAVETAECWALALRDTKGPSILSLSRQNLPQIRLAASDRLLSEKGAYILKEASAKPKLILIATGSEVSLALEVALKFEADGIACRLVSMPCTQLFDAQDKAYQRSVLPGDCLTVSIEAASTYGWARYTGLDGLQIGIDCFGASAPAEILYDHFGLSVDKITARIQQAL